MSISAEVIYFYCLKNVEVLHEFSAWSDIFILNAEAQRAYCACVVILKRQVSGMFLSAFTSYNSTKIYYFSCLFM